MTVWLREQRQALQEVSRPSTLYRLLTGVVRRKKSGSPCEPPLFTSDRILYVFVPSESSPLSMFTSFLWLPVTSKPAVAVQAISLNR